MKVAIIIDTWFPFVGGGQINAWEISKIIASRGHKVDIITRNNGKTEFLKSKNLKVYQLGKVTKASDTLAKIQFCIKVIPFVIKRDYDLVHGHAFFSGLSLFPLKLIKRIPTIFTVHGTSLNSNLKRVFPKVVEAIILTKIPYDTQISVSRDFMKIPNVNTNVKYISNAPSFNSLDKIKAFKPVSPQLLYVGRLHPQKNLINLLKAFIQVKKQKRKIKLTIAGEGPQKSELLHFIRENNLQSDVKIIGQLNGNELIKLYKSSTLFILPSLYEGQSLSLLEAFKAKLPSVVSAVGDSPFLVKEGKNGFLIDDPNNATSIKSAILKALNSKKLEAMANFNYKFIEDNISWQKSADRTLNIYRDVL